MTTKKLKPRQLKLFSWLFILTGLVFILMGLDLIAIDESDLNAPKWIIGLCGLVFSLAGIMILLGEKSPLNNLLGGLLVLSFGCIGAWIAIYGDSANFSGGTPFLSESQNVLIARILFGSGSLMCLAIFIYVVKSHFTNNKN